LAALWHRFVTCVSPSVTPAREKRKADSPEPNGHRRSPAPRREVAVENAAADEFRTSISDFGFPPCGHGHRPKTEQARERNQPPAGSRRPAFSPDPTCQRPAAEKANRVDGPAPSDQRHADKPLLRLPGPNLPDASSTSWSPEEKSRAVATTRPAPDWTCRISRGQPQLRPARVSVRESILAPSSRTQLGSRRGSAGVHGAVGLTSEY
jgi:hypothetical protein